MDRDWWRCERDAHPWRCASRSQSHLQEGIREVGFPDGSVVKNSPAKARDSNLIPESGRSPGVGNGTYSSILAWEIPWTEEAWRATVQGVSKSWTQLSIHALGKVPKEPEERIGLYVQT